MQESVESKVATTTAYRDIVPSVFECEVRCCDGDEVEVVDRRLEAVLARLVSDYRAIFLIEEEVEGGARFVPLKFAKQHRSIYNRSHSIMYSCVRMCQ